MTPRSKKFIVVWDWNGTLVDDAAIFVSIMNSFLQKNSLKKINLKEYKNHFCFTVENYYKKLGFKLTNKEFQALSSQLNISRSIQEMIHFICFFHNFSCPNLRFDL